MFRSIPLWTLVACGPTLVGQTVTTRVREQSAGVLPPEGVSGVGAGLAEGQGSLVLGAVRTLASPAGEGVGQSPSPWHGVGRAAAGIGHGWELTASGALGPTAGGPEGNVGRGALGVRGVWSPGGGVELGGGLELGGQVDSVWRTETVTVSSWGVDAGADRATVETDLALRVVPQARGALMARVPLTRWGDAPVVALAGFQAETWNLYWDRRTRVLTCSTWSDGSTSCEGSGGFGRPSRGVVVGTPAVGASLVLDAVTVHALGFAHLIAREGDSAPLGAMVAVELRSATKADTLSRR